MPMLNRTYSLSSGSKYRFGFNTQEKDDEVYGEGNLMSAQYWEYDTRIGRRWNLDPVYNAYESQYSVNGNNPIFYNDPEGDYKNKFGAWMAKTFGGKKGDIMKDGKYGDYFISKKVDDNNKDGVVDIKATRDFGGKRHNNTGYLDMDNLVRYIDLFGSSENNSRVVTRIPTFWQSMNEGNLGQKIGYNFVNGFYVGTQVFDVGNFMRAEDGSMRNLDGSFPNETERAQGFANLGTAVLPIPKGFSGFNKITTLNMGQFNAQLKGLQLIHKLPQVKGIVLRGRNWAVKKIGAPFFVPKISGTASKSINSENKDE